MIEIDELEELENGVKVTHKDDTEGPIFTGGPSIPMGLDFPVNTFYTQNRVDGVKVWRKFGSGINDWCEQDGAVRNDVANYDFHVPANTTIVTPCREFDGDIIVNGELYIL